MLVDGRIDAVRAVGNLEALRSAMRARGVAVEAGSSGPADSAGVAVAAAEAPLPCTGIGHTRWATHGRVTEENAHPHFDTTDRVHVVVNGIVENYVALRQRLTDMGARFTSETDAEVIAHLIAHHLADGGLADAVRAAYAELRGHYAFVAMSADEPGVLVAARKECPLVVGRGDGEQFIASAVPAFLAETRQVQFVLNDEIVVARPDGVEFFTADGEPVERALTEIDWDAETAEKQGYETFMLKEIHEQADAVAETIGERAARFDGIDLGDLTESSDPAATRIDDDLLRGLRRIVIVACGTSYHAGLIGRYAIEEWARVPVEVDIASEYRYRNPVVGPGDLVIGISQSGETADTLAALRTARAGGAATLAVTNVMGSQITRDTDGVLYTRAGLEVGVAATKTFVSQVAAMYLLALRLGELRGTLDLEERIRLVAELKRLPHLISEMLAAADASGELDPDRGRPRERRLLPLHRPARRPAGCARGRAEAEGDLLHRDRRLRRGRDEARPDRAARREHAGRRRRDALARAREGRLEHAGGPGPGRARDRRRLRGRHRDRRARRGGDPDPVDRRDPRSAAGGDPPAADRLPHRPPARAERRPAPQPRQDGHGRVTPARPTRIGLDLLEIDRLERALERRPALAERLFTDSERAYAAARARPGQHLAARFCAKEAVAKALALRGWNFRDVEVVNDSGGVPSIALHGAVAARAAELGVGVEVSLTHTGTSAGAVAILV